MSHLIMLLIGLFVGGVAGIIQYSKGESDIEIEEYISNSGKKAYRIFKKDKIYDENTKKYVRVDNYLGEVAEKN